MIAKNSSYYETETLYCNTSTLMNQSKGHAMRWMAIVPFAQERQKLKGSGGGGGGGRISLHVHVL